MRASASPSASVPSPFGCLKGGPLYDDMQGEVVTAEDPAELLLACVSTGLISAVDPLSSFRLDPVPPTSAQ